MSLSTPVKTHYAILGLTPWANEQQIRRAYRELSKLYHPDTTELPTEVAVDKFRQLNDAYAVLSNPERRSQYDRSIQFSRLHVAQPKPTVRPIDQPLNYDNGLPNERPLSNGEVFALLFLVLTLITCLMLVVLVGLIRGDRLLPESVTTAFNFSQMLISQVLVSLYL